jgi:hypothetical protein
LKNTKPLQSVNSNRLTEAAFDGAGRVGRLAHRIPTEVQQKKIHLNTQPHQVGKSATWNSRETKLAGLPDLADFRKSLLSFSDYQSN